MASGEVDWAHAKDTCSPTMAQRAEANEALADPDRLVLDSDPASKSGQSIRVIGWSHTRAHLVTVIVVRDSDKLWGANGWDSNPTDQRRYQEGGSN